MTVTVVSYGAGTNSTAMLIELAIRKEKVDLILFSDTGGERPHTYNYILRFNAWLKNHGMPEIITVVKGGIQETLEQSCLRMNALPSLAYGYKRCSQKYKIQPQNKYVNNWAPAIEEWCYGHKVVSLIGFDADEHHRAKISEDKKYIYRYPLVEWDMGRDECIAAIENAGLCLPGKSACFFCPSTKPWEIRQLARQYPDLAQRALAMEAQAKLTSMKGLGRRFAWRDILSQQNTIEDEELVPEMTCGCYDG